MKTASAVGGGYGCRALNEFRNMIQNYHNRTYHSEINFQRWEKENGGGHGNGETWDGYRDGMGGTSFDDFFVFQIISI